MPRYTAAHWGAYRIDGDQLAPLPKDPAPSRVGRGWQSAATNPATRILRPAIRKGWLAGDDGAGRADDSFVEMSWEQAIALAAGELGRVRTTHGNGAIYAGSYGWASAGRFHHAQSQMRRFLNLIGGFVGSRDTYSHGAAEVLWPHVTGLTNDQMQAQMPSWPLIADHASLVVAFGGISPRTAQINSSGTSTHETADWVSRLAARTVNISPQGSDFEGADWLQVRPGTDTALILGLCNTLLAEGLHDEEFLSRCTSGWAEFRDHLQGKSAEWAAAICDVPAQTIRTLARDMAREKTLIAMPWSLQRADHGEMPIWAGLALAAMLGQIGQPGTGFAFGLGSVTSVGRPVRQDMRWPSVPQGQNPVTDFIPVARVAEMLENPGGTYRYNLETRVYPEIKLIYWTGGNPFHHHQDLNRLEQAWTRPETVIVHDHSWTATARRADIVLPCTTPLERNDIMLSRADPRLIYMSAVHAPMGEALDDHEIFRRLAAAMQVEPAFTEGRDTEGWLRWMWAQAQSRAFAMGTELPDFEKFRNEGLFELPPYDARAIPFEGFVSDPKGQPLGTKSGKLMLHHPDFPDTDCPSLPSYVPPFEGLPDAPDGALHLISPQPDTRLHSQCEWGSETQSDKVAGREPCYLHPETAAARGIADGALVRLWNARGATLSGARLTPQIRPDCIALATGAWFDPARIGGEKIELSGNPNVLTRDQGCSGLSQSNSAHTALVFVEPWHGDAPVPRTGQPPKLEPDS